MNDLVETIQLFSIDPTSLKEGVLVDNNEMQSVKSRLDEAERIVISIRESDKYYFADLKPSHLDKDVAVVYIICHRETNATLYVGRTQKLRRRLYTNHLHGNKANARFKKYLVEDEERYPQIQSYEEAKTWMKDNCYFQFIEIPDPIQRGHVEGLLGFMLNSQYIEEEH